MKRIEAPTLEEAYAKAAEVFGCSVTVLQVEIIQFPSAGVLGLFKKPAIIIATKNQTITPPIVEESITPPPEEKKSVEPIIDPLPYTDITPTSLNDEPTAYECAEDAQRHINDLFASLCFNIDPIRVSVYDSNTLLVEFSGPDSALMIGKEGYRYKALSYMLFSWINATYGMQLRLEIAEFLRNQEESISRYLLSVYESVDRDGRAQTKILDGVLVQIALKQLRQRYPDRYVAIRSTRDGGKFVIVNSYHEY